MNKEYKIEDVMEFLRESNFIEGVKDQDSLDQAKKAWDYLLKFDNLTEKVILTTHKILMQNQCLKKKEIGFFRTCQVWVGGREGLDYTQIKEAINDWFVNVNDIINNKQKKNKKFFESVIKTQHVEFEKIHCWVDGNGRSGRMYMNFTRMKLGLPILIIKADERGEYYKWFRD